MRGFQRGIPDVKVRRSRSGLAGTRGLQASHLAKKTINNAASGGLVHHCLWCIAGAPLLWCIGGPPLPLVHWCTTALGGGRYCM